MRSKKSQGISMNTIIIAAIALLVLVILAVIFTGRMGDWSRKTRDCKNNGGNCDNSKCQPGWQVHPLIAECGDGNDCCIEIGKVTE